MCVDLNLNHHAHKSHRLRPYKFHKPPRVLLRRLARDVDAASQCGKEEGFRHLLQPIRRQNIDQCNVHSCERAVVLPMIEHKEARRALDANVVGGRAAA